MSKYDRFSAAPRIAVACLIALVSGFCTSLTTGAMGGVKIRPYGYYRASSVRAVTVEMEDKDYGRMMDWLYNQVGKPYDFMAVIGIVFRRNWRSENKWFCSELVARAFEVGDKPLIRADHVSRVTPAMLDLSTLAETLGCMGG